jgi:hypothetical protein
MGFVPLTTRRIVALESLTRSLAAGQRSWLPVPAPRRPGARRRALTRSLPVRGAVEG